MANIDIPDVHQALTVVTDPQGVKVATKPLPPLDEDHILVKVQAASLNPTDWKRVFGTGKTGPAVKAEVDGKFQTLSLPAVRPQDGASAGSDFSGVVVKVGGKNATKVKVGDAVAGFVNSRAHPANGAFQEYVFTRPEMVWLIPKDQLSFEEAAPMGGIALSTAVQALYHRLHLPTPWAPATESFPILIWGGSTAVGMYAIKRAKLSGLTVATTASPKNHALLREIGADAVYDYKDPQTPALIKA